MTEQSQRNVFVGHARSLVGAGWRHRGRKPWALDCLGLLVLSARAAGLPLEDWKHYGREPWDNLLQREMRRQLKVTVDTNDLQFGDAALIRWNEGEPTHVGIIGSDCHGLTIIHCENINGCVEQSMDHFYKSCIIEGYSPWPVKSYQ